MQNDFKDIIKNKHFPNFQYLAPKRNQKFFGIALTLCALSFFGFFAISPTVSTIFKLQKELSDNQFVLNQMETKIENLTELRKQYSNLQNDLPTIMNTITAQPDITLLLAQIQSVAQTSNVTIKQLQSSEVEIIKSETDVGKDYYSYSFSIDGSGLFENVSKFTQTLTSMERIVNIDSFSISNATDQNNEFLGFSIRGTAFFKSNL